MRPTCNHCVHTFAARATVCELCRARAGAATYKLSESHLGTGLLRIQLAQLESFLTESINLDREGVTVQGHVTFNSVRGHAARYLGWLSRKQEGGAEAVSAQGLLHLLDGPSLMEFCAYLLRERTLKLSTITQAFLSLTKARSPQLTKARSLRRKLIRWRAAGGSLRRQRADVRRRGGRVHRLPGKRPRPSVAGSWACAGTHLEPQPTRRSASTD